MAQTTVGPVLVTGDKKAKVRRYEQILDLAFPVRTAFPQTEALSQEFAASNVVVVYRQELTIAADDLLSALHDRRPNDQIALISQREPEWDVADVPVDAVLTEPISDTELIQQIEMLHARASYRLLLDEWATIAPHASLLEMDSNTGEAGTYTPRRQLTTEFHRLQEEMDDIVTKLDDESFRALFRSL